MIDLQFPSSQGGFYTSVGSALLGPFYSDGSSALSSVSVRHPDDFIEQGFENAYGEKGVSHLKHEGTITYNPLLALSTPVLPRQPYYPNLLTVPMLTASGSIDRVHHPFGMAGMTGFGNNGSIWWRLSEVTSTSVSVWSIPTGSGYPNFYRATVVGVEGGNVISNIITENYVSANIPNGTKLTPERVKRYFSELRMYHSTQSVEKSPVLTSTAKLSVSVASMKYAALNVQLPPLLGTAPPLKDHGTLVMEAVEDLDAIDSNLIEFATELRSVKSLIPKLKKFMSLDTLSGNYLGAKYGILPTLDDVKSILGLITSTKSELLNKDGHRTRSTGQSSSFSSGGIFLDRTRRAKIAVGNIDNSLVKALESLENFGFGLTLSNFWDLVPYSFVVDWFVDIGSVLDRVDARNRIARLPIMYCTQSDKTTTTYNNVASYSRQFIFNLSVTSYRRWVSDQAPLPSLSTEFSPTFQNHWLEGTALLIQRRSKK